MKRIAAIVLSLLLLCPAVAAFCEAAPALSAPWNDAVYTADTEVGEGEKTLILEVKALDTTVTFTVHTDAETVGTALAENGIITGEEGPYGMFIKAVDGMTADYNVDQSYWAFFIDGDYAMSGVDGTEIREGAVYQLVYTR